MRSVSRLKFLKALLLYHRILMLKRRKKRISPRRWWVKDHLKQRNISGAYRVLFLYFKEHDYEEFYELTWMTVRQFDLLHKFVKKNYKKQLERIIVHRNEIGICDGVSFFSKSRN